jgi:phosphoglycolate phosphatase
MGARGSNSGIGLVIFDLDGTLVDSAPDLAAAVDAAFAAAGLPAPGEVRLRRWIGDGARTMVGRALEWANAGRTVDPERLYAAFVACYRDHIAVRSRPYPGIVGALDRLAAADTVLAVATNKSERLARRLLAELHLDARFASVVGGDTFAEKKPAAMPLIAIAERTGHAPASAVMIGDAPADILAARAAGMRAFAAGWGYGAAAALTALGPERILEAPEEIPRALGIADAGFNPAVGAR